MVDGYREHPMTTHVNDDLVELFASLGVPAAEIPEDLAQQIELASDAVLGRADCYSLTELAATVDRPVTDVREGFAHLGITVDDLDDIRYSEADAALAEFLPAATTDIMMESEGLEILQVIATSLETLAEAAVAGHVQGPARRLQRDSDGVRLNAIVAELGLELGDILPTVFRHHLRQAAHRQRRTQNTEHRELVELTVGFVDLVGFTSLSHSMTSLELVEFVKDFEGTARETARAHQVRISKMIGDEVMFVAEESAEAAGFATDLIATFQNDRVIPRGGVAAGSLITLHGDYFGPIVNLAARLVDAAVPGEVLVTAPVADLLAGSATAAGRRMLRGFDNPVEVWSLSSPA